MFSRHTKSAAAGRGCGSRSRSGAPKNKMRPATFATPTWRHAPSTASGSAAGLQVAGGVDAVPCSPRVRRMLAGMGEDVIVELVPLLVGNRPLKACDLTTATSPPRSKPPSTSTRGYPKPPASPRPYSARAGAPVPAASAALHQAQALKSSRPVTAPAQRVTSSSAAAAIVESSPLRPLGGTTLAEWRQWFDTGQAKMKAVQRAVVEAQAVVEEGERALLADRATAQAAAASRRNWTNDDRTSDDADDATRREQQPQQPQQPQQQQEGRRQQQRWLDETEAWRLADVLSSESAALWARRPPPRRVILAATTFDTLRGVRLGRAGRVSTALQCDPTSLAKQRAMRDATRELQRTRYYTAEKLAAARRYAGRAQYARSWRLEVPPRGSHPSPHALATLCHITLTNTHVSL